MFQVEDKKGKVIIVYGVKKFEADTTLFLIYKDKEWCWVLASEFVPC